MAPKTAASWNTLINGHIRNGDWSSAWKHFQEMPRRDRISWNTMIGALVQAGGFEAAISLFREMQSSEINPDEVAMVSVASACGYLAAPNLAKWIYAYINKTKFDPDVKLNTALIDMFARCGDAKTSMKIFDGMPGKDVPAWTAAIGPMATAGDERREIELFYEMIGDGLEPDCIVFVQVLTACSHGGLVDEGREFFRIMTEDYGLALHLVHYGCMVDLLGRAGLLEEARSFVEIMPIEPNDVIWGALLAASTTRRDLEMAEYAAGKVLELAPERSGIHMLLSNAYASAGRWKDVAAARLLLREKGGRKLPGCRLIEIEGVIHEFTSGDESHRRWEMISGMMEEMGSRVSVAGGHVAELEEALMDVGEEEKVVLLSRHGEKIAVAFGLIITGRGVPIRVVKNLRICGDCFVFSWRNF
ncbi:Pentatricopeptide repeat-containing protein [Platanthera guangdongensis]|uniref:Pentatricopeptide repeat-containing protein n=1 Tax=Platanthera guangdongensis TaxID=2320717 RepID=A0ABR2MFL3_9ASPA